MRSFQRAKNADRRIGSGMITDKVAVSKERSMCGPDELSTPANGSEDCVEEGVDGGTEEEEEEKEKEEEEEEEEEEEAMVAVAFKMAGRCTLKKVRNPFKELLIEDAGASSVAAGTGQR